MERSSSRRLPPYSLSDEPIEVMRFKLLFGRAPTERESAEMKCSKE